MLNTEQQLLCRLLRQALNGEKKEEFPETAREADMGAMLDIANRHKVLPFLYDVLCEEEVWKPFLSEAQRKRVTDVARGTVKQSYRLLFLTRQLVESLEAAGLPVLVLKGCGVAALYPVPELRKSGDVDILIRESDLERATEVLKKSGCGVRVSQHANHHLACCSPDGIDVELHTLLAEPFRDEKLNRRLESLLPEYFEKRVYQSCMEVSLPVPMELHQALQLLLHMLQHFLRAGFGLKLLCDWTVFWNREGAGQLAADFLNLAEECHIRDFAETVTKVCKEYLGLNKELEMGENCSAELAADFLLDVFEAEEFGKASGERMVIVQKPSVGAYLKEFHYQMKLNHPRASRHILLWPGLWVVTLVVFLRNNRKLNRGSVKEILRSAGRRSRLVQQMGLWEETS